MSALVHRSWFRLALSLAMVTGFAAPAMAQSTPLGFDTVFQSAQSGGAGSAENRVVRDNGEWAAAIARFPNLRSAVRPDFNREIAVIAFMGLQNTGGHSVAVTKLEQDRSGVITATVNLRFPAPGDIVTQAFTSPIHVIKFAGSRESVRFDVQSNKPPTQQPGPLKFITVSQRVIDGGSAGAENVVVRDDAEWRALVSRRPALSSATKPDFDEEMAIGVFLGQRPTGGYSASIDEVALERDGRITVRATATSPAPGQIVTQAFTSPYHVVAVRKIAGPVNFVVSSGQQAALGPISFATIDQGAFAGDTSNNRQNLVIRNDNDFGRFWRQHTNDPLPQVDFSRETVVALLAGRKTTGGHSITATAVERVAPGRIEVTVETKGPPPGGFATTVITYPFHIIRMKATGDQYSFKDAATVAQPTRFDTLSMTDNRDLGQGNYARTTIVLRADGTATRTITSPFIRTQPINGTVSKAELDQVKQLFAATEFFDQSFPVPVQLSGDFTNLSATDGRRRQSYDHQTGPLGPPKGKEINALENALRNLNLDSGAAPGTFDQIELVIGEANDIVTTTTINDDGSARRTVVGPTIRTRPIEGFISDGDLARLRQLLIDADLTGQQFPIPSFVRGTPTTSLRLDAKSDSDDRFVLYETGARAPGAKPRELQALVDFVNGFEIRERAFSFDTLSYNESFFGFILESETITIQANGDFSISRSTPGGSPNVTQGKLSSQQLAQLQGLFDATDFFNQSFPQPLPAPGSRLNTITAENGGRNQVFSYPAGGIVGPKAAELQALEAFLKALLGQQTGTRKYDEIEYAVLDDNTQESRQLFIRDGEVQFVLSRAGTSVDKAQIDLSQDEKVALQAAFGRANVFSQPDSFPELGAPSGMSYTLTARAGRDSKTIRASTASSGPRDYEAFRQALDALLDRFKAREIVVEGVVQVLESFPVQIRIRPNGGPSYNIVGDFRDELEALAGREVKVRGTSQGGNDLQVIEILSPKEIVFTGTIARSQGRIFIGEDLSDRGAQLYQLAGPLAASLRGLSGQVVTLRGLAFETEPNRGTLEVSSIFARARARAPAYPFGSLSQDELVEIKGLYGRLAVVEATINGTNQRVQVITFTNLLRPVAVSTPGLAGALRGSGR